MIIDETAIKNFREHVYDFYRRNGRHDLPWRQPEKNGTVDPYKILVSELMLQQTQVTRVIPKYIEFIEQFPNLIVLANCDQSGVVRAWSGLGYNRRAIYVHQSAKRIASNFRGQLPKTVDELTSLPGVGSNTAGAILAYAFNIPSVFIETNIRTVIMHHFLLGKSDITDRAIADYVSTTLDASNSRQWYWALMDYGSYLKRAYGPTNAASRTYRKQSKFSGSMRQLRGQVIRLLSDKTYTFSELAAIVADPRLEGVLQLLVQEKLIIQSGEQYRL